MQSYTTGEMAKLCGISVRTVQFYDAKGLLKPSQLTEGGRRIYTEDDLAGMRIICTLKSLGLSLSSIKDIMHSGRPIDTLSQLLKERQKQLESEAENIRHSREIIDNILSQINASKAISLEYIIGMEQRMKEKKKMSSMYIKMSALAAVMAVLEVTAIVIWAVSGLWWVFAVTIPIVIILTILLINIYYKNARYICPECQSKFKPKFSEFLFANHTPKMRKLTCTKCRQKNWCIESCDE